MIRPPQDVNVLAVLVLGCPNNFSTLRSWEVPSFGALLMIEMQNLVNVKKVQFCSSSKVSKY